MALGSNIVYGLESSITSSARVMTSAIALPLLLSNSLYTFLNPGSVILSKFSLTFKVGTAVPFRIIVESLYTPPNTGSGFEVISFSPTPNESICAP